MTKVLTVPQIIERFATKDSSILHIIPNDLGLKKGKVIFEKVPLHDEFRKIYVKANGDRVIGTFDKNGKLVESAMENSKGFLRILQPDFLCKSNLEIVNNSETISHLGNGRFQYSFNSVMRSPEGTLPAFVQGYEFADAFKRMYAETGMKWPKFDTFINKLSK